MTNKDVIIEKYYKDNYTYLLLLSYKVVKDKDAAKDIVQEFFLQLWQRKDLLVLNKSFKTYSAKAIKNLSVIHVRKKKKEKLIIEQLKINTLEKNTGVHSPSPSFNSKMIYFLDLLPEKRRNILISSVIYGHKYSDIAEDNNISINSVKTQIKRAYSFFRENYNYVKILFLLACLQTL